MNAFKDKFPGGDSVRAGASIHATVKGITYTATVHRDYDSKAPEDNMDGFWPSRDPKDPGWIGDNPTKSFELQMAECRELMTRYKAGKMVYCGIVISASRAGIELLMHKPIALWCVDINWPGSDNSYLLDVANDLFSEAQEAAESELKKMIDQRRKELAALER